MSKRVMIIGVLAVGAALAVWYFTKKRVEPEATAMESVAAGATEYVGTTIAGTSVTKASDTELARTTVQNQVAYNSFAGYAERVLANPTSPTGALATAVAKSLPNPDLAVIGEITDTGIIGPLATQNLIDAGATVEYNPNTTRAKLYYDGVFVAYTVEAKYNPALYDVLSVSDTPIAEVKEAVSAPTPQQAPTFDLDAQVKEVVDSYVALPYVEPGDWSGYEAGVGDPSSAWHGAAA